MGRIVTNQENAGALGDVQTARSNVVRSIGHEDSDLETGESEDPSLWPGREERARWSGPGATRSAQLATVRTLVQVCVGRRTASSVGSRRSSGGAARRRAGIPFSAAGAGDGSVVPR